MTMRVMIVDDEEFARRGVRTRLQKLNDVEIVAECKNGREAVESIRRISPDLVFLDVQMPGKSGFDTNLGSLEIPDLTNHDDIRVLTQKGAQSGSKVQADILMHLHLIDTGKVELYRILGSGNVFRCLVQLGEG